MPLIIRRIFLLIALLILASAGSAPAMTGYGARPAVRDNAPGDLDPSFGNGGKVRSDIFIDANGEAYDLLLQPDGKVVAVGSVNAISTDFGLIRFNADGSIDTSFGRLGTVSTDFAVGDTDVARAAVIQPDGKIVAAGHTRVGSGEDFALARYNTDGSLDPGFGTGGKVTTSIGVQDAAYALILQPDGKLVAGGKSSYFGDGFTLVRYNPNGSLDTTFGNNGIVNTPMSQLGPDILYDLALQPDGKIVAAGDAATSFGVARYNPNGSLDTTFDGDGKVTTLFFEGNADAQAYAVALQPDGKIVAAGSVRPMSTDDFALARYNPNGSLDPSFSGDGRVVNSFSTNYDHAQAVKLQPDGKIVAGGVITTAEDGSQSLTADYGAARYNSDGSLDTSFGGDGWTSTYFLINIFEFARALVLDPAGRLVLAGGVDSHPQQVTTGLLRYNPDGSLDTSFGSGGKQQAYGTKRGSGSAYAVVAQQDGKILAGGMVGNVGDGFRVVRYNPDGSPDASFGGSGEVRTMFNGAPGGVRALVIQPDGKIVAAGHISSPGLGFAVARYNVDGSLDVSFGTGGFVITYLTGESSMARAVALQPDGKIVAAGYSTLGFMLTRYNTNGSLDTSFGGDGIVTTDVTNYINQANAVGIGSDGKIVAAGEAQRRVCAPTCVVYTDMGVVRYNPDGSPDTTFAGSGQLLIEFSPNSYERAQALVIQPDNRIVVAGVTGGDFALARSNTDGTLDSTFGGDGLVTTDMASGLDVANALILQDGKLVAAGSGQVAGNAEFALARYNLDGSLDTGFGTGGKVLTDLNGYADIAFAMSAQQDGKLVAAGLTHAEGFESFGLARYLSGDGLPSTHTPTAVSTPTSVVTSTSQATQTATPSATPPATATQINTSTPVPATVTHQPTTPTSVPATHTSTPCTLTFTDVPTTNTFHASVRCLACRLIISGYSDGTFRPNNEVTRGQLAKMVSEAARFNEPPSGQTFEDVPSTHTFYTWIERLATRGYMAGYPCGGVGEPCLSNKPYFRPFANATRGQSAKIVANAARFNEPVSGQTFQDVPPSHTFYDFIQRLAARNVMQGYPCGGAGEPCVGGRPYFRPGNDVTRGQSAKIVANSFYPDCVTP